MKKLLVIAIFEIKKLYSQKPKKISNSERKFMDPGKLIFANEKNKKKKLKSGIVTTKPWISKIVLVLYRLYKIPTQKKEQLKQFHDL